MKSKLKRTLVLAALMASTAGQRSECYRRLVRTRSTSVRASTEKLMATADQHLRAFEDLEGFARRSIGAGYGFSNGFRLEGELSIVNNQFDISVDFDGCQVTAWSGLMANLYLRLQPWWSHSSRMSASARATRHDGRPTSSTSASDTGWAYQGHRRHRLRDERERNMLDIGYRYFAAPEVELSLGLSTLKSTTNSKL
jgi:hypothetical protein